MSAAPPPESAKAPDPAPHAVARLRAQRLARALKPFRARGSNAVRCEGCRLPATHCLCALRPSVATHAGVCLLMADIEPLKPSNTGWLIADVVRDTWAFGWARTEVDPQLLALLADPQWQPYVVFPGEFAPPERVVQQLASDCQVGATKRPLLVLLDATWTEARKMFRKSPYLDRFPVLSLHSDQISRYRLRRSKRDDHFCTAEVGAMCLEQAGDTHASQLLDAYFDVFTTHYLLAKRPQAVDWNSPAHQQLRACVAGVGAL